MNLDLTLSLDKRIVYTVRKLNFHMRTLRQIRLRPLMQKARGIVGPSLDHCNSLFYGLSEQNCLTMQTFRAIYSPRRLRRSLHWLLMRQHVDNKVANRKFKARQQLCVLIRAL